MNSNFDLNLLRGSGIVTGPSMGRFVSLNVFMKNIPASSVVIRNESAPLSARPVRSFRIKCFRKVNVANQCVKPDLMMTKTSIDISSSRQRVFGEWLDVALSARRRHAGNMMKKVLLLLIRENEFHLKGNRTLIDSKNKISPIFSTAVE